MCINYECKFNLNVQYCKWYQESLKNEIDSLKVTLVRKTNRAT